MDHLDATDTASRNKTLSCAEATLSANKRAKIGRMGVCSVNKGRDLSEGTMGCIDTAGTGGVGGGEGMKKVGELATKAVNVRLPGAKRSKQVKKEEGA